MFQFNYKAQPVFNHATWLRHSNNVTSPYNIRKDCWVLSFWFQYYSQFHLNNLFLYSFIEGLAELVVQNNEDIAGLFEQGNRVRKMASVDKNSSGTRYISCMYNLQKYSHTSCIIKLLPTVEKEAELCSSSSQGPLELYFKFWVTRRSQFLDRNHVLDTLNFTGSEHWAP